MWFLQVLKSLLTLFPQIFLIQFLLYIFSMFAFLPPSPGMVMQLHSFLQEHPEATMEQIDNILDGNICRCVKHPPIVIL